MFHTETGNLIDRMLRGEPELLPAVLDRARVRLVLWVHPRLSARLRAKLDAEDAAHEVYLRVLRSFPDFDGDSRIAFYAWLFTIARNTVADLGKHHGAQKRQARELPDGTQTSPSQHAIRRESLERLLGALDRLDEGDRRALSLRYLEELGYDETARALGCSPGAARVRVCRALARLKDVLVDDDTQAGDTVNP